MSESISPSPLSTDPLYFSVFQWLPGLDNSKLVFAVVVDDKNRRLWIFLSAAKKLYPKIPQINRLDIGRKSKVP